MTKVQSLKGRTLSAVICLIMFFCSFTSALGQNKVTGTVKDSNGEPLVGVTVMEAGTQNGTVTNMDGQYSLDVKPGAKLTISYIGYTAQTVAAKSGASITLVEDSKVLSDVVVIGYGSMRRKDVTSSITTVKAEDLNTGVFSDAASMLQGKVPGLVVTTNGNPNGTPSMTLRGASTLRTGDAMQPYYVIDGIPGVDISMVAPDDIESIDVLRDATATAIYGSKAANGVIIITTKSGSKSDRVNVTYSGYVAVDNATKTLDMATADDIRSYVKTNGINYMYDEGGNVDWQKEVLRTGISHNHNVNINGGNESTNYMASINYMNRQGIIKGTSMSRMNARTLLTTKILKDHLQLSAGVNLAYGKHAGVPFSDEGRSVLDAMNYANPTSPIYYNNTDQAAGHVGQWHFAAGDNAYNPLSMINEDSEETNRKRMQFIAKATAFIFDGFTWNANFQYSNNQSTYSTYHSHATQLKIGSGVTAIAGETMNGVAQRNTYFGNETTFETYGNYDHTFNKVHKLGLMAGFSWEERVSNDGFGLTVHNFLDDTLKWNNLTYAGTIDGMTAVESGTKQKIRNISFYGRLTYSYNSRYMLQATMRRDGSSVFGEGHQWGTFPSVSVAWNITEEGFMQNQNVFSNLKLRGGYGVSGNALGFGAYAARATYGATGSYNTYNGNQYVVLGATKLANKDLKWEKTGMLNIGLDYAFLNGRINGSIEWYKKTTKDLIWDYPVSSYIYNYSTIAANVGQISNTGVEFNINIDAIRTKDFNWNTSINLSHNKNKVDKLSNEQFQTSTFTQGDPKVAGVSSNGYTQRVIEGEPIGTFYTYEFAGYNDEGISTYYTRDATTGERDGGTTTAPEYKDRTITGSAQPKLNLGWNNNFTYKNWSLTMFFTGVFGNKIYNGLRAHYTAPDFFAGGKNVLKEFVTDRPYSDTSSNIPSDKFIEKGDYFRMQSLTLGYTFKKFNGWIESLNVYGTCNNVFTITGYKGLDPEVNLGGIDPGVDYRWSTYPHTRTFMVGVKINFGGAKAKKAAPVYVDREVIKEIPVEKEVIKEVVKEVPAKSGNTYVVTFEQNVSEIANTAELDGIKAGDNVEIVAYASPEGNADANQVLSQKRADAVAKYLKDKGVNVTRIDAKGADSNHANRIAVVTVK